MTDSSIPPEGEWCPEHFQYNCTELSHGISEPAPLEEFFLGSVDDGQFSKAEFTPPAEVTDLPPESITDGMGEDTNVVIGDGSCHVCGAPTFRPPGLTKAGHKKRTPKYCDLHDPKLRVSKERPVTSGVEGVVLAKIQGELADDLRLLAVMAGPLLPVTGMYVYEAADPFTAALLNLCKNNQRALRILHRAATVAPVYEVAKDCAGLFYAIQVDMKKLEPHNTVSRRLGVEQAYNTVYPNDAPGNETNVGTNGSMGPPRYAGAR